MPGIGSFTGVQSATVGLDTRLVASGDQVSAPTTQHWGRRLVTSLTSSETPGQQNRATVDAFRGALDARYGREIGGLAYDAVLQDVRATGAPLTARIIARADVVAKTAELERTLTPVYGKPAAAQAAAALRAANPGPGALTAVQMQQAVRDATTFVATARAAAQIRIANVQADTGNQYALDGTRQGRVLTAMGAVAHACPHRAAIYAPILENVLARLDDSLRHVDHAGAPALLGRIAQQIADKLDHLVLCGVVHHACNLNGDSGPPQGQGRPVAGYAAMMTTLNAGGIGLENLAATHPATLAQLCTLGDQLATSIGEIGTRFRADMGAVGTDVGTRFAGQPATGLTDIRLTDSDPHKGGHRVAILTMADAAGTETRVVYKPRDVRIDAKLVGVNNDPAVGTSLAEYTEQRIADDRNARGLPPSALHLPTYTFMPRTDPHGDHYGYVQCLSHDTDADRRMDVPQARDYHRNLGRQIAMLSFAGARDLHHTNVMVSGRQPCFTDLELSFEPDVFRLLTPGSGNSASALAKMQVEMAVFSNAQFEWQAPATVVGDTLTLANNHPRVPVTENLIHVAGVFEDGSAIDGNNRGEKRTFTRFADDVHAGFNEVIGAFRTAAGTAPGRAVFNGIVDGFGGMHARYHPVGTPVHLATVKQKREYAGPDIPDADAAASMQRAAVAALTEKNAGQAGKPADFIDPVMLLQPHHEADWAIGDVPYFVRPLGTADCLHNGVTPVTDPARGGHYFGVDPLQQSKDMFARLADPGGEQVRMLTGMADTLHRKMGTR